MMSSVLEIYTAPEGGAPMVKKQSVVLEAGKGIVGDRYHNETGSFSKERAGLPEKEVTLIESEKIAEFNQALGQQFTFGDFRCNLITEGIALNELVGKEFIIGNVVLKGIRLCEPCENLAGASSSEAMSAHEHKVGLCAQILNNGIIQTGNKILI